MEESHFFYSETPLFFCINFIKPYWAAAELKSWKGSDVQICGYVLDGSYLILLNNFS